MLPPPLNVYARAVYLLTVALIQGTDLAYTPVPVGLKWMCVAMTLLVAFDVMSYAVRIRRYLDLHL